MSTYNNNEDKLLDRFGRENPFRVPEGYFDTFPNRVMSQITKKKKRRDPWRWAVAAVFACCVAGGGLALFKNELGLSSQSQVVASLPAEQMNELLDCNMVSNLDIENYLTEAE